MAKINNYHLYDFQEQDKFDGLVNEQKSISSDQSARIAAIEKKNVEQDNDIEEAKRQDKFVENASYDADDNTLTVQIKNGNSVDIPLDSIFKDSDLVQKEDFDAAVSRVSDIEKNYVSASTLNDYYTKEQTSGKTEIADALSKKSDTGHTHTLSEITDYSAPDLTPYAKATDVNNSLATKQDKGNYVSATTLSNYYKKSETSGTTEIQNALDKKQNTLTIDDVVNDTSTNPIQNKAVYEYINPKEKTIAASLNELDSNKLDASAYTEPDFETLISKSNSVKALTNLPTDKYSILATISASGDAQSISFDSIPAEGSEYMIDVYNTSGSDITLTYPTDNYQVDSTTLTLPNGKITSISVRYVFGKYVIKA
jgi:hypothetical protein